MARVTDKPSGVFRSLDWWTILIYMSLLIFGWLSVCGASYTYGDTDIFSLSTRSGMQIIWIASSDVYKRQELMCAFESYEQQI